MNLNTSLGFQTWTLNEQLVALKKCETGQGIDAESLSLIVALDADDFGMGMGWDWLVGTGDFDGECWSSVIQDIKLLICVGEAGDGEQQQHFNAQGARSYHNIL